MNKKPDVVVQGPTLPEISEANANLNSFIDNCSNEVFRTFLPRISKDYCTLPCIIKGAIADSVAYFEVAKLVENEKEQMVDCLKSVYHVLANSGCGVSLVAYGGSQRQLVRS